jgi:hypothetical protein
MVYADYAYYTTMYMGVSIPADDFPRLAVRASSFLDYYTQGRAEKRPELDALKMACCAIADQYQVMDQAQALMSRAASTDTSGELQSQSVGGWTKTYRSGWDGAKAAADAANIARSSLADIAQQYLAGTGLIYRGGRCCHVPPHGDGL